MALTSGNQTDALVLRNTGARQRERDSVGVWRRGTHQREFIEDVSTGLEVFLTFFSTTSHKGLGGSNADQSFLATRAGHTLFVSVADISHASDFAEDTAVK